MSKKSLKKGFLDPVKVGKWTFNSVHKLNPDGTKTLICDTCSGSDQETLCKGNCWKEQKDE